MLAITEQGVRRQRSHQVADLIDGVGSLRERWLRVTGSVVLPQESGLHFDDEQRTRLAAAFAAMAVDHLVAVPFEDATDALDLYRVDATATDLCEFSFECGSLRYVLVPEGDEPIAVVCTIDDYFLVAGSCAFVRAFAPDIKAAQREFMNFVDEHFDVARPGLQPALSYMTGDWDARRCSATGAQTPLAGPQ